MTIQQAIEKVERESGLGYYVFTYVSTEYVARELCDRINKRSAIADASFGLLLPWGAYLIWVAPDYRPLTRGHSQAYYLGV